MHLVTNSQVIQLLMVSEGIQCDLPREGIVLQCHQHCVCEFPQRFGNGPGEPVVTQ